MEVFHRSWRTIAVLMLIGVFIPSVILGSTNSLSGVDLYGASMDEYDTEMIGRSLPSLIAALIVGYLTALAWTAALRAAVKESVGESVSVGESLAYGLRRGLRLWGWGILAYLTVVIGLVLCVLPGLWALFALSLIAPAATFEAGSPYVRSIKLTHRNFGGALGRLVLAWLVIVLFGCVVGLIGGAVSAAAAVALSGAAEVIVLILVQAVMSLVLIIPSVWLVGMILCTYVWARGRTEPVSAASLSMEADR
ncbi:hypothetical protein LX16_4069 [Stackebrandtia albiflava]|uniref:Glycerophosphoryl diester phosphodiesterase family protein n=2 Tax=Stackebrandtia albiflava TaxID=406432 RepID=A0A562UYF1_9ACTN|nr:hypothetical protein LX16_4069 [Stackebrandtia albiflava]